MEESQAVCPVCHQIVLPEDYFCKNCGKSLKETPLSTAVSKQLKVYLISLLLPPLGLWPAFKYLRQPDEKAKRIGWVAIILTFIATLLTIWYSVKLLNGFNEEFNRQMNLYQGL